MKMKKLTRIKLINWHYFIDVTIDINESTLITGDNGSGKSTILDALQFVLTGGKAKFNSAAHENARRNLLSYIRCKTGVDSDAYERKGDVTSHVAIEFFEEAKKKYFIIGVVIDSASDLSTPKDIFYRIENLRISNDLFIKDKTPININAFKLKLKQYEARAFTTQIAAQADFCNRFGSFNDRFFSLLSKALAFRPINSIKDFVYSYVLDQKEVNIEYLKENVRTYREFEKILKEIKVKIGKLEIIQENCNEIFRIQENIKLHEYIILRSQYEIQKTNLDTKKQDEEAFTNNIKKLKENELVISGELQSIGNMIDDLRKSILNNETFQVIDSLEKEIKGLKIEFQSFKLKQNEFDRYLKDELNNIQQLYKQGVSIEGSEEFIIGSKRLTDPTGVKEFSDIALILKNNYSKKYIGSIGEKAKLDIEKQQIEKEIGQLEKDIKTLESKRLVYDENVLKLKKVVFEEIKKVTGLEEEPKILCELLHIQEELWQNAVEGYLNTQRFDLIVPPEYFDISLAAYEAYKKRNNIHSVGLVNTQKVLEYEKCEENSLAYVVTSENRYAKCYTNQLLGKVVRCEKLEDIKKYQRSITPTCMVYQNNTARQTNPLVYQKPYIGADAYKKQLEIKLKERQVSLERLKELHLEIAKLEVLIDIFGRTKLEYIQENCDVRILVETKDKEIINKEEQLKRIDKGTIIQIQLELSGNEEKKKQKEGALNKTKDLIIKTNYDIENILTATTLLSKNLETLTLQLSEFEEKNTPVISRAKEKFEEESKSKSLQVINANFYSNKKGLETRFNNCIIELIKLQSEYNNSFHFGAAVSLEGMEAFQWEYQNLKGSRMIEYEENINNARKKAEEQFKEHFIAKLQENIYGAQQEFKKLNNALKGIKFGEDEYEFKCNPSKEYNKFYEMVMDENNLGADTLFSGLFQQRHKEAMDELFARITIDDEQSQKALEKFTDYRTFLDYDIKIYHDNGSTSSFSKVCREKSGGETQTPYYVAISASFLQLYDNALHKESIGVMLFDEAFDKMDDNRIESMMKFLKNLKLQVIMAAPPQKIESISPFIGTTLVVSREDKFSWVEALYINE